MEEMNGNHFQVRTDLALEERERFPGDGGEIRGVELKEWEKEEAGLRITEVVIKDQAGARAMGKPMGTYMTLEAPRLKEKDEDYHREVSVELSRLLCLLLSRHGILAAGAEDFREAAAEGIQEAAAEGIQEAAAERFQKAAVEWFQKAAAEGRQELGKRPVSLLAVGLGNREATPDSLGPRVLSHLQMTRHFGREYGETFCEENGYPILSGITPGVMAQTGMETAEILKGIVAETKPDAILVIDALAARSVRRLGTTIQLADTGIHPGSGVGNYRNSLTEETLGVPVFALGVPTVVGAAAIVQDTADAVAEVFRRGSGAEVFRQGSGAEDSVTGNPGAESSGEDSSAAKDSGRQEAGTVCGNLGCEEQQELIRELLEPRFGPMYVTPHNIDEQVETLSFTISEAIHGALFS